MPKKQGNFPGLNIPNKLIDKEIHDLIIDEQSKMKKELCLQMFGKGWVVLRLLRELIQLRKEKNGEA